jgi:hypothetical protein
MSSIPAFQLNEEHQKFSQRLSKTANYQIANMYLTVVLVITAGGWGYTAYALHENSEVIKHFKPRVVRENELGQTALLVHQELNMDPDQRSIRSALSFWATYHLDHVKATIGSYRSLSFTWMPVSYAESIRSNDRASDYIRNALVGADPEYRIEVSNTVLTTTAKTGDGPLTGEADIYAHRRYIENGIPKALNAKDAFVIHVKWCTAIDVPDNLVALNPLGIAITYYDVFNSTN